MSTAIANQIMDGSAVHVGGGQTEVAEILAAVMAAWEKMSMYGWRCKSPPPAIPKELTPQNVAGYCRNAVARHTAEFPGAYGSRGFSLRTHYTIGGGESVKEVQIHHDAGQGVWAVIECAEAGVTNLRFGVLNVHRMDPNFSEFSEKLEGVVDQLAELVEEAQKRGSYCYLSPVDDDD